MKKLLMAVAAFGMLLTSCAKDDTVAPVEDKEALVSFCVNSPAVATRYGEGETAQDLYYAVYDTQEGFVAGLSATDTPVTINISTTVNLNLVQGRSYEVIFWAQAEAEDAPYTLAWGNTAAEATMTYDPQATLTANNEAYDAFYAHVESFEVKGAVSQTVELKRPFAQLNVATADTTLASTAGVDIATTGVEVSGVYTSLNLANDTVDGETTLTFAPTTKANGKISANGKEYDHIAMNYLLVNAKKLVDVTLTLSEDNGNAATDLTRNYTSVPVQRNYRTNIIGNILTSTADFNVEIKPGFTDEIPATLIEATDNTGTITINSAEGLLALSKLNADWADLYSNGQGTEYSNYAEVNGGKGVAFYYKWNWTIKLGADIDLKGATIDPINISGWGTFDGQGHTIKNATIETATNVETAAGLFITNNYNSFKNVVLDNIHVKGSLVGNSTAGILAGSCHAGVDKITISNSSVWGGKYTGGIVGYGYTSVTNCTLTNCEVKGGYKLGGVIGYICSSSGPKAVEGNKLTNCTVAGTDGQYAGGKDKYIMGRIVGNFNCDGTCKNNTIVNMTTDATTDIGEIEAGKNVIAQGYYTADTAGLQAALDAAADGEIIHLTANVNYGVVYMGRPTASNNTVMYCETHDFTTTDAAAFKAHLGDGAYHTTPRYTTTLKNITIVGAEGATVAGLVTTSGHAYGTNVHDYVLDVDKSGSVYYNTLHMENIKFQNVAFTGKIDINTSDAESTYNGVTFEGCTFTTGGTASTNGPAIRYYNEANNGKVQNIVVKDCEFNNCYQGVYVHHVNGVTVTDNVFNATGHNAVALQGHDGNVDLKNVVIENNTFNNIGDRVIRFNNVGADSNITIQHNTATNSGDAAGEVIKATSIAAGVTTNVGYNNWNGGVVVNPELRDTVTGATSQAELNSAIAAGVSTISLTAGNYTMPESDLRGKTLTIVGAKDVVIDATAVDTRDQFVTGAAIVFEGVTINFTTTQHYMGFANCSSLTYKNCDLNGWQFLTGGSVKFENCNLNSNGAEHTVWTYGAAKVSFDGCKFAYGDRCVNVYSENGGDMSIAVSFDDCKFIATDAGSKGAVEINSSAFPQGASVDFTGCTAPANGPMVFISGWDSTNGATATVKIDGVVTTVPQGSK